MTMSLKRLAKLGPNWDWSTWRWQSLLPLCLLQRTDAWDKCKAVGRVPLSVSSYVSPKARGPPPSCPRLRRTISCRAPMLPSMASSSLAFMSLDFLKVRLFIRSNAFFPCIVNTTWALYPWRRGRAGGWAGGRIENRSGKSYWQHGNRQVKQVSRTEAGFKAQNEKGRYGKSVAVAARRTQGFLVTFSTEKQGVQTTWKLEYRADHGTTRLDRFATQRWAAPCTRSRTRRGREGPAGGWAATPTGRWTTSGAPARRRSSAPTADRWGGCGWTRPRSCRADESSGETVESRNQQ